MKTIIVAILLVFLSGCMTPEEARAFQERQRQAEEDKLRKAQLDYYQRPYEVGGVIYRPKKH